MPTSTFSTSARVGSRAKVAGPAKRGTFIPSSGPLVISLLNLRLPQGEARPPDPRFHLAGRPGRARGDSGQGRHRPRRALLRPCLARHRRGLERVRGTGAGDSFSTPRRALRTPRGDDPDLPPDVVRRGGRLRGQALPAGPDAQLAPEPEPPPSPDPDRGHGRAEDAPLGRPLRAGLQPLPDARAAAQAGGAASPLR